MSSSRGFGELGATKKMTPSKARLVEEPDLEVGEEDADLRDDLNEESENEEKEPDEMTCPNCSKVFTFAEAAAHTV